MGSAGERRSLQQGEPPRREHRPYPSTSPSGSTGMPGGVRTSCSLEEQRHWPSLQLSSALFSQQDPILPPPPPFTTGQEEVFSCLHPHSDLCVWRLMLQGPALTLPCCFKLLFSLHRAVSQLSSAETHCCPAQHCLTAAAPPCQGLACSIPEVRSPNSAQLLHARSHLPEAQEHSLTEDGCQYSTPQITAGQWPCY